MNPYDPLFLEPFDGVRTTDIMSLELCNQFQLHAQEMYPNECVGYVKDGAYHRLENISDQPTHFAELDPQVMLKLMSEGIDVYCHSHPDGPDCPSVSDRQLQLQMDVPCAIVSTNGEGCLPVFFHGTMMARPPLLGRPFRYGVTDCFEIARDFYEKVLDIRLKDKFSNWEWWLDPDAPKSGGLYVEHFSDMGFEETDDELKIGDGLLMRAGRTEVPNHLAVYIGDHLILHHLGGQMPADYGRLSVIEPLIRWHEYGRVEKRIRYRG